MHNETEAAWAAEKIEKDIEKFRYQMSGDSQSALQVAALVLRGKGQKSSYEEGYAQALADISTPMVPVCRKWEASECPRCGSSFVEYEECNDGYYRRAYDLGRCPYCGQKLDW